MLFWLPKSGGVGVMLQNQAFFQWYQQLMMLGFQDQRRTAHREKGWHMLETG